jgi:hypothetical protein
LRSILQNGPADPVSTIRFGPVLSSPQTLSETQGLSKRIARGMEEFAEIKYICRDCD